MDKTFEVLNAHMIFKIKVAKSSETHDRKLINHSLLFYNISAYIKETKPQQFCICMALGYILQFAFRYYEFHYLNFDIFQTKYKHNQMV